MFEGHIRIGARLSKVPDRLGIDLGGAMVPRLIVVLVLLAFATAASAASPLELKNDIFVERIERLQGGKTRVTLEEPRRVGQGDRLVFVLRYRNADDTAHRDLVITNPLPDSVAFSGEGDERALLSVDNGRHWGKLEELKVPLAGGRVRAALPEDVTHIRWRIASSVPAGGEGKFIFRGRVR